MTTSIGLRALGAAILVCPLPALAAPAQTQPAPKTTTLTLSVTGTARHAPDAMEATLEAVGRAGDAAKAQDAVNRMMAAALHGVDKVKGLTGTTGGYSVVPADPKQDAWIARQSLTLHFDAAPNDGAAAPVRALIGQLQHAGMQLQSLAGTLRDRTAAETRNRAIVRATHEARAEARVVAHALDETVGGISAVTLGERTIHPMMTGMVFAARAAAPVARPGPVEERVSLSATIELAPKTP